MPRRSTSKSRRDAADAARVHDMTERARLRRETRDRVNRGQLEVRKSLREFLCEDLTNTIFPPRDLAAGLEDRHPRR